VIAKPRVWPFGISQHLSISKLDPRETEILANDLKHAVRVEARTWGTAVTLVGGRAVLVKEFGIVFSDDDSETSYLDTALIDVIALSNLSE
jgi:hypothetical protein